MSAVKKQHNQGEVAMAYIFSLDSTSAFKMAPTAKQGFGYLVAFQGLGMTAPLAADLTTFFHWTELPGPSYAPIKPVSGKLSAVAVLETVSWSGGARDPFSISCYMSGHAASLLRSQQQQALTTLSIPSVGWWIGNFDQTSMTWFEEHYSKTPVYPAGMLNKNASGAGDLQVANAPVQIASDIDATVYNVTFQIIPAMNQTATFVVSPTSSHSITLPWGV
jgi:hypothetical protein